jgi:hypothetical protein
VAWTLERATVAMTHLIYYSKDEIHLVRRNDIWKPLDVFVPLGFYPVAHPNSSPFCNLLLAMNREENEVYEL